MKTQLQACYGPVPLAFGAIGHHSRTASSSALFLPDNTRNNIHHDGYISRNIFDKTSFDVPRPLWSHSHSVPKLFSTSSSKSSSNDDDVASSGQQKWMNKGLLISSFSEGLKSNTKAHGFLRKELLTILLEEKKLAVERAMKASVMVSPCNGPDISIWNEMDKIDDIIEQIEDSDEQLSPEVYEKIATITLPPVRIAYVPTATYALRLDSDNTPGKQRQRARAECKERRDDIVRFLYDSSVVKNNQQVLSVTVDFDDGSMKQPELNSSSDSVKKGTDLTKLDLKSFPRNGKEALQSWKPHLLYVQGGNTFWLHHCITKGEWQKDIINLVTGTKCIYIGGSAGAIVTGSTIETACWKKMDDPRVIPGKENYSDWKGVTGLQLLGNTAIFPHYDDKLWREVVQDGEKELEQNNITTLSVRQTDVYLIDGSNKKFTVV